MAAQLIVHSSAGPLRGSIPVVGDEEVALCRVALAACSRGTTTLRFAGARGSLSSLLGLLNRVGVSASHEGEVVEVRGAGLFGLAASDKALDLRGDADVAGIGLGLLVSRSFESALLVDDIVAELLAPALREAHVIDEEPEPGGGRRLLLRSIGEGQRSPGISVSVHGAFPWVKRAILLAGLRASSPTVVEERLASADHLERAMVRARLPLDAQGTVASLHPPRDDDALAPQTYDDIGSTKVASALLVASLMRSGSEVSVRKLGTNPTRSDWIPLARMFGARMGLTPHGDRQGEPFGTVTAQSEVLRAATVGGEVAIRLRDDILPFLALAARAEGTSSFSELVASKRGADPSIWSKALGFIASAGGKVEKGELGFSISGRAGGALEPLRVTTGGDSRLAVLGTALALGAKGTSVIDDVACLASDYPRWFGSLRALGAQVEIKEG